MTRRQKKNLVRILLAALLTVAAALLPVEGVWKTLIFLIPYAVIGYDVLYAAVRNILHGQVFDERFLMTVATLGAFAIGEYLEGVAVMLLYQIGELFQGIAVGRSRRNIATLMDIRPDMARVLRDGEEYELDPEEVASGEILRIYPGERIPLDGIVLEGESHLDTSALTGESLPRRICVGDTAVSGSVNMDGELTLRAIGSYGESTVARILELTENAAARKAKVENFITRFAKWYTPCVVSLAILLAFIPPIFLGNLTEWVTRALNFLVVSCPCALVISIPLSFFGGIGGAARRGILIKGAGYLEALASVDTLVFDKTGTLTEGRFSVTDISPCEGVAEQELLALAAAAESHSRHPIARAVAEAGGNLSVRILLADVHEYAGMGMAAVWEDKTVLVGNVRLFATHGVPFFAENAENGTHIYVALNGKLLGSLTVSDTPKSEAAATIKQLRHLGIRHTVMLTGDRRTVGEPIATSLGIDEARCELLPGDKVGALEELLSAGRRVAFAGDGINDAPVLSRADVGIAMGALGSDAAIEAADVVLMDDRLEKIPEAVSIARRTMYIVRENLIFALTVKPVVLILSALGLANMWMAIFADVGVMILAVLNAMRAMHLPTPRTEKTPN